MLRFVQRLLRRPTARLRRPRSLAFESVEQRMVLSTFASSNYEPPPLYKDAPALPAPIGTVVNVSTVSALQSAVWNAEPNTTIVVAPGTYQLANTLHLENVSNVSIRGATGNRDDVVLVGRGMTNADYRNVPHGILLTNAQDVLIADLTIRDVWYHSVALNAGTERPVLHNLRLLDAGEQFVKASVDNVGGGVDGGIVQYSLIEYTTNAPTYYTNGVDVHTGIGWSIRDNVFRNIRGPAGQLAGPAVLVWNGSRDTVTSGNLFLNVERAIHYGLLGDRPNDHVGGSIHNNFIYRSSSQPGDVGIGVFNSPDTDVLHNTIVLSGTYPNAIEYRFSGTTGVVIANNLSDAAIARRDSAQGTISNNITTAGPEWFVDAAAGDLHLAATSPAIDAALASATLFDFDGQSRPSGGAADVGADEVTFDIEPLNHAPLLDTTLDIRLYPVLEDAKNPAGTLVSRLLDGVTDVDAGDARGLAITSADGASGKWQFTLNGGVKWQVLGTPTAGSARLLAADNATRVRFIPNADFAGEAVFSFRAWDQTQGTAGSTFDLSSETSYGGSTAFSAALETATVDVIPVNDAPVLSTISGSVGYKRGASPIQLTAWATVTDIDSPDFADGHLLVQITSGGHAANRLEIRGTAFSRAGDQVIHNGLVIGTIASDGVGLNALRITFTSHTTPSIAQQLVRSIYFSTSGSTTTATRTVAFTITDGDGGESATLTKRVNVK